MLIPNKEDSQSLSLKQVMEVDTVIATHELIELFEKMKVDFKSIGVPDKDDQEGQAEESKVEESK